MGLRPSSFPTPLVDWSRQYEVVFERAMRRLGQRMASLEEERNDAARIYSRLVVLPAAQRRFYLLNLRLDRAWSLADLLIARGHDWVFEDCRQAIEIAELAVRVSPRLSIGYYGASLVAEIRARSWACLGHACRVAGNLGRADEAFQCAHTHLAAGNGEPVEEGLVLDFEASLHATRGRLLRAEEVLDRASSRFRLVRDHQRSARALLKQGIVAGLQRRWPEARGRLEASAPLLDPDRDAYAAAVGFALLATLRLGEDRSLQAQIGMRQALRRAREVAKFPVAWRARPLVRRVEWELEEHPPKRARERLFSVWPRWL